MPPRWQIGPPGRKLTQPILPPRRRRLVVLVSDLGTPCFLLDPWNLFLSVSNLLDEEERMLVLHQEMGDLCRQNFETMTLLDILTTAAQTVVWVVPSGLALLVDCQRAIGPS